MFAQLKDREIEVATKLINDGLSMARTSLEHILNSPIHLKKIDYGNSINALPRFDQNSSENYHLIRTELIGQIKGTSHLIFSETEVEKIFRTCLPQKFWNDTSAESVMMKTGFLTEIDNMVAAAVITEFANFFDLDIFGHVPSLHVMPSSKVNDYLTDDASSFDSVVHFKAILRSEELDISPDFVWFFQNQFVEKLRQKVI